MDYSREYPSGTIYPTITNRLLLPYHLLASHLHKKYIKENRYPPSTVLLHNIYLHEFTIAYDNDKHNKLLSNYYDKLLSDSLFHSNE